MLLSVLPTIFAWNVAPVGPALSAAAAAPVCHARAAAAPHYATARGAVGAARMILLDPEQATAATAVPTQSARLLDSFLEHFQGHFDNHEQVKVNEAAGREPRLGGGHEHIHCVLRQVPVAEDGPAGAHVLASYYFNGQPAAVFRERLYAFDVLPRDEQFGTCVRMRIYKLRDPVTEQLRAAGGVGGYSADDVALGDADLADELLVEGADVFWRWCGERYEGQMRTESLTLVSERSGTEIVVRDDVALWADALWVNDRGHDAVTGEYVYGNIHEIPYKMTRVSEAHWTATGVPNPAAAEADEASSGSSE